MRRIFLVCAALLLEACGSGTSATAPAEANAGAPAGAPADWPAPVPVPSGSVQSSTSSPTHWVLSLVADGSYSAVMSSTAQLYVSRGFAVTSDPKFDPYIFFKAPYQVTIIAAARDHSNAKTNLFVYVDLK